TSSGSASRASASSDTTTVTTIGSTASSQLASSVSAPSLEERSSLSAAGGSSTSAAGSRGTVGFCGGSSLGLTVEGSCANCGVASRATQPPDAERASAQAVTLAPVHTSAHGGTPASAPAAPSR